MEKDKNGSDVLKLLDRAGVQGTGTYREFRNHRGEAGSKPGNKPAEVSSKTPQPVEKRAQVTAAPPAQAAQQVRPERPRAPRPASATPSLPATTIGIFSLAGGVGKTTLALNLTRALCSLRQRVLIVNCAGNFELEYLYGENSHKVGPLTLVHWQGDAAGYPLMLADAEELLASGDGHGFANLLAEQAPHTEFVLLDLPASRGHESVRFLEHCAHVLVPLNPDTHSLATVRWLQQCIKAAPGAGRGIHYLLNRYNPERELHREIRDRVQEMVGEALLPISLADEPLVQDAINSGVTLLDYAPDVPVAQDLRKLAAWLCDLRNGGHRAKGRTA